jgi:hypothetical protein
MSNIVIQIPKRPGSSNQREQEAFNQQVIRALQDVLFSLKNVDDNADENSSEIQSFGASAAFVTSGSAGRTLVAGDGITFVDTGAGGTLTISADITQDDIDDAIILGMNL